MADSALVAAGCTHAGTAAREGGAIGRQFHSPTRRGRGVTGPITRVTAIAIAAVIGMLTVGTVAPAPLARAATAKTARTADSPAPQKPAGASASAKKAPSKPPLATGSSGGGKEETAVSAPSGGEDPIVNNGLGSPMCRRGPGAGELSPASESNCRTSGFEAASAPTGNYEFDVHINTGLMEWMNNADSMFEDLLEMSWTVLVAIVHGVIVMLDWCYALELLNSPAMSGVAKGLRQAQATFTQPWLVLVLSVASVLALYHGLVRRQVAETVGQALMMLVMMVGGLWVIMNPAGTIGALGSWANQAGLGTLGAVTAGTPDHPNRTLAESMQGVFSGGVEGPWCYLEFGDVRWCNERTRLDPGLHTAGLKIASSELDQVECKSSSRSIPPSLAKELGLTVCVAAGSGEARALEHSAELLRRARTNGEIFLALPANGEYRNAINKSSSLFNLLCGGSEEPCKGPTASQAAFRTTSGTWWRFVGLAFIWLGALGMVLMLGFLALRLLAAAILALFFLLLAPAAVLAPALGDGGRAAFRGWGTRLLSAVMSKLIYSFLLGVLLLMQRILTKNLTTFGWFTQWLLISTMWWGAFLHRNQMLSFAQGGRSESRVRGMRLTSALMSAREAGRATGWARRKLSPSAPNVEQRRKRAEAGRERAKAGMDEQAQRVLEHEYSDASATVEAAPEIQERLSAKRAQLDSVQRKHAAAQAKANEAKNARESALTDPKPRSSAERKQAEARFGAEEKSQLQRAATLKTRMGRLQGEIAGDQSSLTDARKTVIDGEQAQSATGKVGTREQVEERSRFLDAQAALPSSAQRGGQAEKRKERDYAGMAGLAGYGRKEFEGLDSKGQRAARREIDRELALRKELSTTAKDVAVGGEGKLGRRERQKVNKRFDSTLKENMRESGHKMPASRDKRSGLDTRQQAGRAERRPASAGDGVMSDLREVEAKARRKRQMGRDRR
jgi:hypothetical protein